MAVRWKEAYYPLDDRMVKVSYALNMRRKNGEEYRENPCYNSKEDYNEGLGIKLTPVNNSENNKVDHFRAYGTGKNGIDNYQIYSKLVDEVGLGNSSNTQYRNTAIRVKTMINFLASTIVKDKIASEQMEIEAVDTLSRKELNTADVLIIHKSEFHRRTTRIFVEDIGRKPTYNERDSKIESISNWFLDIKKYAPDIITNWDKVRPLLMRDWKSFDTRTRRELSIFDINESEKRLYEQKKKNFKETGFEETDEVRKNRESLEEDQKAKEQKLISDAKEIENERLKNLKIHNIAKQIIRDWRGLIIKPTIKNPDHLKIWNEENKILSHEEIERINRLDTLTQEPNFEEWANSEVPWGEITSHGRMDYKFRAKKVKETKEEFYELVTEVSEIIDKISSKRKQSRELELERQREKIKIQAEKLELEKQSNFDEYGTRETNIERENRESLDRQKNKNFQETKFQETNHQRYRREKYISHCDRSILVEYNKWKVIKNRLIPINSLLNSNRDLNKIPQERHKELRELWVKASEYTRVITKTFEDIITKGELTRAITSSERIWEDDSHLKVSKSFKDSLEILSGSTSTIESLSQFFLFGEIKKIIEDNKSGYIALVTEEVELLFHQDSLRGVSFSDLHEEMQVLLVQDSGYHPAAQGRRYLVFRTLI